MLFSTEFQFALIDASIGEARCWLGFGRRVEADSRGRRGGDEELQENQNLLFHARAASRAGASAMVRTVMSSCCPNCFAISAIVLADRWLMARVRSKPKSSR